MKDAKPQARACTHPISAGQRREGDDFKKICAALTKLEAARDKKIRALAGYAKAGAELIAPAAGLSLADIVCSLAPESLAVASADPCQETQHAPAPENRVRGLPRPVPLGPVAPG
ncbi:hypothetical protein ACFQ7J_02410 [Streptomyces sp. NPDC056501]|uniref:hypothetical protein n=1 Tax=Streptomyces sp. NPDC056501 TaxID=3345841 RepID=UPI0036844C4C